MVIRIQPRELQQMAKIIGELSGIVIDSRKDYLVETRLSSLVGECGCKSFGEFLHLLSTRRDRALCAKIIDAITTNETLFFRDGAPFECLRQRILPDLISREVAPAAPKTLRIWSAACSTGQEIYSVAMIIRELLPSLSGWSVALLGTDIAGSAIAQARLGRYSQFEVSRGLPPQMLSKHFEANGSSWEIREEVRAMVTFAMRNLHEPFAELGRFDVILCRNVAIYFSPERRASLFRRLAESLTPDGALFVGATETLSDMGDLFVARQDAKATHYQIKR
jgi:chemotaxis protein methyltransferase CheR